MQARKTLAAHCRAELAAVQCAVHVPAAGQAVDASEGCNAYRLALLLFPCRALGSAVLCKLLGKDI